MQDENNSAEPAPALVGRVALVLPDLHGRAEVLREIVDRAGEVDAIVSVGDAVHGGYGTGESDLETLEEMERLGVAYVVGNHELPFVGGPAFLGWDSRNPCGGVLRRLHRDGLLLPSAVAGGYLITHAGVAPHLGYRTSYEAHDALTRLWYTARRREGPLAKTAFSTAFHAAGRARGGCERFGGVTWRDDGEPLADFAQVYGHTPGTSCRLHGDSACIDLGVGLQVDHYAWALLSDDGSATIESTIDAPITRSRGGRGWEGSD